MIRKAMVCVGCAALGLLATASFAGAKRLVIGTSVRDRPIVAWTFNFERARRKVLVVGCIHGDECAGFAIVSALRHTRAPKGVQLWLVPGDESGRHWC